MKWGSVEHHARAMAPFKSRRRCTCGCKTKVTHLGQCNGVTLMSGCELEVRRWVKDWRNAYAVQSRLDRARTNEAQTGGV